VLGAERFAVGTLRRKEGTEYDVFANYPATREPTAKLRFRLSERSQPEKLCSFRLEQIPLPLEVRTPELPGSPAPRGLGPYFQRGGGTMASPVLVRGNPAAGRLSIGLSRRTGREWGSVRWLEVEVDGDAPGRLEDLQPGIYRVLRVFHASGDMPPAGGRWRDGEVRVEVPAGKAATAPPPAWASPD